MNRIFAVIVCLLAFSASAFAVSEVLPMKNKVRFNHFNHMNYTDSCFNCHVEEPGRIKGFGKDWGHETCKGCHIKREKGPQRCSGCHKWNAEAPDE